MAPSEPPARYEPNRSNPNPTLPPHSLITYRTGRYTRPQLLELKRRLIAELRAVRSLITRLDSARKTKNKRGRKPGYRQNPDPMMRKCRQIIMTMMRRKRAWAFNEPVDVVGLGLYDYHRVVERPMDLGTVKSNLDRGVYSNPLEFAADVRLTFANAAKYNPLGHPVHRAALNLLAAFGKTIAPLLREYDESRGARGMFVNVVGDAGTDMTPVSVGDAQDEEEDEEEEEEEAAGGHLPVVIAKEPCSTSYTNSSCSSSTDGSDLGSVQSPLVGAGRS